MLAKTQRLLLLVAGYLLLTQWAHAAPKLNGMAIHTELGKDQFVAAVYAETLTSDARQLLLSNEAKAMEVRVLTETIYARRFNRMWIEGIAINAGSREMEKYAQDLASFSNMMRVKLRQGDVLRIERDQSRGTVVRINGVELGEVGDPALFDLLLRTWVGPVPLSSGFKDALLGEGKVSVQVRERFESIQPSAERIAAITAAITRSKDQEDSADSPQEEAPTEPEVASDEQPVAEEQPSSPAASVKPESPSSPPAVAQQSSVASPAPETPEPSGLVSEDEMFEDESIFDEDDEVAFTAESLLSEQLYISKLTKWTGNYVKYPKFSLRNDQQGTVRLTVTLARSGKVVDVQYMEKSQYEQLNRAASRAVKNASPYPAVPDEIAGDTFVFTVPVVFRLR